VKVDLRTVSFDVPPQEVSFITHDLFILSTAFYLLSTDTAFVAV